MFGIKRRIMGKIDEVSMRKATIMELRNIARDIGVVAPTTYSKEELIKKVLQIYNKEVTPSVPKSRQGRPPKQANDFYNVSAPNPLQDDDNMLERVKLMEDEPPYAVLMESKHFMEDEDFGYKKCSGYVYYQDNNYFVVNKNNPQQDLVYIPSSILREVSIKEGDFILGTCKQTSLGGILSEIADTQNYTKTPDYATLSHGAPSGSMELAGIGKISLGGRNVVVVKDLNRAYSMREAIKSSGMQVLTLNLDTLPEDVEHMDDNCFYTTYGQSAKRNTFIYNLFMSRVKRLAERGEKVIVFVNELMKLVKYQNYIKGNSMYDVKEGTFSTCISLLNLASTYSNGASITLVALLKEDSLDISKILKSELENMNCNFI